MVNNAFLFLFLSLVDSFSIVFAKARTMSKHLKLQLYYLCSDHHDQGYSWDETGGGAGKRTKISHPSSSHAMTSWDIDGGLAADFDGSLSGLGTELGTSSYNMRLACLCVERGGVVVRYFQGGWNGTGRGGTAVHMERQQYL